MKKTYKITYTSLLGRKACQFIKATGSQKALRSFREKFSSYKPERVEEVVR